MPSKRAAAPSWRSGRESKRFKDRERRRVPRNIPTRLPIVSVKRTWWAGSIQPSATATSTFWSYVEPTLSSAGTIFGTSLNGLTNLSEYVNLFDLYKVNGIVFKFVPRLADLNQSQQNQTTGLQFTERPRLALFNDPMSQVTPAGSYGQSTFNSLMELGNVKDVRGDRQVTIYVKPKVREEYGIGAVRYVDPQWTNLSTAAGQTMPLRGFHIFGYNWGFGGFSPAPLQAYDVYVTYYLQFKGMR